MKFREENYIIRPLLCKEVMALIIEKHYLHRKCPCSFAFGLIKENKIVGVCMYGTPSSAPLRRGIAGDRYKNEVIELTRLWIEDSIGRNAESFLIGNTIRKINKKIIVSFADTSQGHLGIVYQASNFLYTGLSAKRTDWTVRGINKHGQTLADKYTVSEMREHYGDDFFLTERPRKHRYIFINASSKKEN